MRRPLGNAYTNWRQPLPLLLGLALLFSVAVGIWWAEFRPAEAVHLTLATGPQGAAFHSIGQGIAKYVHRTDPSITISLTEDSVGSQENMQRLKEGEVQLAIVQNDTEPADLDVQTLLPLHRGVCHFLVPMGSDIKDIYDLRNKTVAVGNGNSGNYHLVHELLAHFGILEEENEFDPLYQSVSDCGEKLEKGEVDAILVVTALTSQSLSDLVCRGNVRYVSLADSAAGNEVDGFAVVYPYIESFTIPKFVYPVHDAEQDAQRGRPMEACESFAIRSSLICRTDLPDHVARTIVEAIVTHRAEIMREHREARDITEHFDPADVQFPLHHGAVAYYQRQRPSMLERYAEPMAFLLSLFLAFCGFVAAFNKWLTVRKKNRIDRYYVRLDMLLTELNSVKETRERLDAIEEELLAMRHDAVRELVSERLLADDSFQIFQSLLTDCHHQLDLQRQSLETVDT